GEPCFLEVNPLAGLNPVYSDLCIMCRQLNFPYEKLILFIVNEAMERGKQQLERQKEKTATPKLEEIYSA
ncbi:MAG: hypothetical protein PHR53_05315, partial [Bacteroidales bacterium]|nr:hypothetical protein [Bacteroidales bacterium]